MPVMLTNDWQDLVNGATAYDGSGYYAYTTLCGRYDVASRNESALTDTIQLRLYIRTTTGSFYSSGNINTYTVGGVSLGDDGYNIGTVGTGGKFIGSIRTYTIGHNADGTLENVYVTSGANHYGNYWCYANQYISLPPIEVATIRVFMGSDFKKGNPYVFESGANKKGKLYRYNGSSWVKGK